MEYKVGDRVRIKSLDWYNENKDELGNIDCGDALMTTEKSQFCGKIVTISNISDVIDAYKIEKDNGCYNWTDEMIEGLVKEETYDFLKTDKPNLPSLNDFMDMLNNEIKLPEGYQFKDENGNVINATKIVLEKKKKEYPKTYEECCKILGHLNVDLCFNADYSSFDASKEQWKRLGLMNQFYQLLICRDAYWKIAGEEMGLGEPWEPSGNEYCFVISRSCGEVYLYSSAGDGEPFEFPTKEMRDAFKKNFDPDIEFCKELL